MSAYSIEQNPDESSLSLVVWQKDGSKVVFNLADAPKITYEEEKVIIQSSSIVEYDFQSIQKMTYDSNNVVKIENLDRKKEKPFTSNGETITFLSSENDLRVQVVSLNGTIIHNFSVKRGSSSSISLRSFSTNVYMIIVNGVTYKIMLK